MNGPVTFHRVCSLCIITSSPTGDIVYHLITRFCSDQCEMDSDIQLANVMMDPVPLLSEVPHPAFRQRSYDFKRKVKQHTCTECPTRFYIIDFGLSRTFSPGEDLVAPVSYGGDKSVPEYKDPSRAVSNPFAIDVYCLGNLIREWFMDVSLSCSSPTVLSSDRPQESRGCLKFLKPLVDDMTCSVPEDRPTIDEAIKRFEELLSSLSVWNLRSRYVYRDEFLVGRIYRACRHAVRTAKYLHRSLPALPTPPAPSLRMSSS